MFEPSPAHRMPDAANPEMIYLKIPVGMLQCNCSIIGDPRTLECIVVDPGDEVERILSLLGRYKLTVKAIVSTHAHIDHIGGAQKLKQATGAAVYMNANDTELKKMLGVQASWLGVPEPEQVDIDVPIKDGDRVVMGAAEFHVLHTPGHTPEHICLLVTDRTRAQEPWLVVTGHTLMVGDVGRTELVASAEQGARDLFRSLARLKALPDFSSAEGVKLFITQIPNNVRHVRHVRTFEGSREMGGRARRRW